MKVNVMSRKLVKPCNPTPPQLRRYKISLSDEVNPAIYHVRILYFSSNDEIEPKVASLEESMAQILSNFYPLAGRYDKAKREVDCGDQGALFAVAEVDGDLLHIIAADVDPEQLNQLLPVDVPAAEEPTDPILAVQINRFRCGGLAIGVCALHRVIDSTPFALFIMAWAKAAASRKATLIQPHFDAHADLFPFENLPPLDSHEPETHEKIVTRRLVFDGKAIQKLRERLLVEWESERPPSRVVTVSAFLTQALLRADMARRGREPRAAVIAQLIDVRERTVPPVPKHAFGTWLSGSFLELTAAEAAVSTLERNLPTLAGRMRKGLAQGIRDCSRLLRDTKFGRKLMVEDFLVVAEREGSDDCKVIWVTDVSKLGEYEADFGFGKPEWVSIAAMPLLNHIILLNNRTNDGIEAWVCLLESDMKFFRQDKEIPMLSLLAKL